MIWLRHKKYQFAHCEIPGYVCNSSLKVSSLISYSFMAMICKRLLYALLRLDFLLLLYCIVVAVENLYSSFIFSVKEMLYVWRVLNTIWFMYFWKSSHIWRLTFLIWHICEGHMWNICASIWSCMCYICVPHVKHICNSCNTYVTGEYHACDLYVSYTRHSGECMCHILVI